VNIFKKIIFKKHSRKATVFVAVMGLAIFLVGGYFVAATMKFVGSNTAEHALIVRTPNATEEDLEVSSEPVVTTKSTGSSHDITDKDLLYTYTYTSDDVKTEAKVNASIANNKYGSSSITYKSLDPAVATVDSSGNVSWISDGSADILVRLNNFVNKIINVAVSYVAGNTTHTQHYIDGTFGKIVTNSIDNKITDVTSGNAATKKKIFTTISPEARDFANFTSVTVDSGGSVIYSVAYGNGVYVAVGENGKAYYSTNLTNWTSVTLDSGGSVIRDIVYGNGYFVAVGAGGQAYYSSSGTSWTTLAGNQTTFLTNNINSIAYGKGYFVAVGAGGKGAYCSTPSGTWTSMILDSGGNAINDINFTNASVFAAVGDAGLGYYSGTGTSWTKYTIDSGGTNLKAIASALGKHVAVGEAGKGFSTTGAMSGTWYSITVSSSGYNINGIIWGIGAYVAVGNSGFITGSNGAGGCSSGYLTTWYSPVIIGGGANIYSIINVDNNYIAVGAGGKLYYGIRSKFLRNTSCWATDIDLSAFSVATDWGDCGGTGTKTANLISPRHVLFASHYVGTIGAKYLFVTQDNQVITRTLVARLLAVNGGDIAIGILDQDIPSNISYFKVLPSGWYSHFPGIATVRVPAITSDSAKNALVGDLRALYSDTQTSYTIYTTSDPIRSLLFEAPVGGDSSSPAILLVDEEPVLIGSIHYIGGSGDSIFSDTVRGQINNAMDTLSAGQGISTRYHLTEMDLSDYPSY